MARGLFLKKNFAEDSGPGFREGIVRVDLAEYRVIQKKGAKGGTVPDPCPALVFECTRLDADTLKPMVDSEGAEIHDVLDFGLGSKALSQVHPGKADGPDDKEEDIIDAGVALGSSGPTLYFEDSKYKLHPKTGMAIFAESLEKVGWSNTCLAREWAPDFNGAVFEIGVHNEMKGTKNEKGEEDKIPYKIAKKIISAPYEKGKGKGDKGDKGEKGSGKNDQKEEKGSSSGGGGSDADDAFVEAAVTVLEALAAKLTGKKLSIKTFRAECTTQMEASKIDTKARLGAMKLLKDLDWLNADKRPKEYEYAIDPVELTIEFKD